MTTSEVSSHLALSGQLDKCAIVQGRALRSCRDGSHLPRSKTDAADAEAICEAVIRKSMRFVPIKSADQQAAAMVLKARELLVRQRPQAINALRAHLAELGIIAGTGTAKASTLIEIVRDAQDASPAVSRAARPQRACQSDWNWQVNSLKS